MKGNIKVEENGSVCLGLDTNEDGQNSITGRIFLGEGFNEILAKVKKGEAVEPVSIEAKSITFSFEGAVLSIGVDTDRDGEKSISLDIDMAEALEEGVAALKK